MLRVIQKKIKPVKIAKKKAFWTTFIPKESLIIITDLKLIYISPIITLINNKRGKEKLFCSSDTVEIISYFFWRI